MNSKTAQEIQDRIFEKMPYEKKLRTVLEFSDFCSKLRNLGEKYGARKTSHKNKPNFRRA